MAMKGEGKEGTGHYLDRGVEEEMKVMSLFSLLWLSLLINQIL
jgi:hypothetical protein